MVTVLSKPDTGRQEQINCSSVDQIIRRSKLTQDIERSKRIANRLNNAGSNTNNTSSALGLEVDVLEEEKAQRKVTCKDHTVQVDRQSILVKNVPTKIDLIHASPLTKLKNNSKRFEYSEKVMGAGRYPKTALLADRLFSAAVLYALYAWICSAGLSCIMRWPSLSPHPEVVSH